MCVQLLNIFEFPMMYFAFFSTVKILMSESIVMNNTLREREMIKTLTLLNFLYIIHFDSGV